MAVLSDYTSGTITLANGSTAVTGTGTLFDVAKFREGDTLQIQNLTAVIASVNSNVSLTLTAPWTGTSLTNAPYRARYLPDGARVTAQATTLIELLGNGVLSSLAEIGVEDGKVPVGNAAGQYELVDTDEFGLQDPNGSLGKLAALTLAARQVLQTDETGALKTLALAANKFLRTDANGDLALSDLGAAAIALLNLAGTAAANKLPYLSSATGASLADITAAGRAGINTAGTAAANTLAYNTSTTASALTTLTAFARTILDDADAASVWSTIGGSGFVVSTNAATQTGAVGSYAMARTTSSTNVNPASNASGSDLYYANGNGAGALGVGSGSWKCMGHASGGGVAQNSTLWLRYA